MSSSSSCFEWCRALSMMPAKSHSARAEGFGRIAPSGAGERLGFRVSACDEGISQTDLPVSAGGDVCRVLKRPSDRRVRSSVRRPHKRTVLNTLLPQFSDFIPVMRKFTIECCLCSISAHIQGRTPSGDSSVGQNISQPGLRSLQDLPVSCRRPRR